MYIHVFCYAYTETLHLCIHMFLHIHTYIYTTMYTGENTRKHVAQPTAAHYNASDA